MHCAPTADHAKILRTPFLTSPKSFYLQNPLTYIIKQSIITYKYIKHTIS